MGWESTDVVRFDPWAPRSRSNDGLLALVNCLSGGYKFALVLRCTRSSWYCKYFTDFHFFKTSQSHKYLIAIFSSTLTKLSPFSQTIYPLHCQQILPLLDFQCTSSGSLSTVKGSISIELTSVALTLGGQWIFMSPDLSVS